MRYYITHLNIEQTCMVMPLLARTKLDAIRI